MSRTESGVNIASSSTRGTELDGCLHICLRAKGSEKSCSQRRMRKASEQALSIICFCLKGKGFCPSCSFGCEPSRHSHKHTPAQEEQECFFLMSLLRMGCVGLHPGPPWLQILRRALDRIKSSFQSPETSPEIGISLSSAV